MENPTSKEALCGEIIITALVIFTRITEEAHSIIESWEHFDLTGHMWGRTLLR